MQLKGSRVLLTGAAGGIGRAIARELIGSGAHVLMVDRDTRALELVAADLASGSETHEYAALDLTAADSRAWLCRRAEQFHGGVNVLINNAGLSPFGWYEDLVPAQIDATLAVNLHAPMHLCHELLPLLRAQAPAAILNTGSVFGAIGYPGYAAYAATKFALRGFTEALRREVAGSGLEVKYFAPRATRTPINSSAVERMNEQLGVAMDPPERVARELVALLGSRRDTAVVGWPEKLFVKVNALLPSIVDRAIRKQRHVVEGYARPGRAGQEAGASIPPSNSLEKVTR